MNSDVIACPADRFATRGARMATIGFHRACR